MPETENGNRNKTETFKVRCTPQQRKEFDAEAERLGLSLSEFWFICFTDWRARQEERLARKRSAPLKAAATDAKKNTKEVEPKNEQ